MKPINTPIRSFHFIILKQVIDMIVQTTSTALQALYFVVVIEPLLIEIPFVDYIGNGKVKGSAIII